jgi:hypothetical protein
VLFRSKVVFGLFKCRFIAHGVRRRFVTLPTIQRFCDGFAKLQVFTENMDDLIGRQLGSNHAGYDDFV